MVWNYIAVGITLFAQNIVQLKYQVRHLVATIRLTSTGANDFDFVANAEWGEFPNSPFAP